MEWIIANFLHQLILDKIWKTALTRVFILIKVTLSKFQNNNEGLGTVVLPKYHQKAQKPASSIVPENKKVITIGIIILPFALFF